MAKGFSVVQQAWLCKWCVHHKKAPRHHTTLHRLGARSSRNAEVVFASYSPNLRTIQKSRALWDVLAERTFLGARGGRL